MTPNLDGKQIGTSTGLPVCAVLLAGGRGTRFWPRSRRSTPKQLLNIVGSQTMLRQTMARLESLIPARRVWVVTNRDQAASVRRELRAVPQSNILAEPVGRNTAAAIGLAAVHLAREHGDALMVVVPSDAWVREVERYRRLVRAALELARRPGNLIVLGIPPTRPETGYGYIERGGRGGRPLGITAFGVRRFTEKPALPQARNYIASGKYFWNAGMFIWRVSTFLENLERFLPATYKALIEIARTIGSRRYRSVIGRIYARLKNISVDYAIMEPATRMAGRTRVFVIPARMGWSDIGSWAAVYELMAKKAGENESAGRFFGLDATGNYFWSPQKLVAAIGVHNLVLVETDDALLVCARERSQDVGRIVEWLERTRRRELV
jgi:mannose-1-phosphate guanylyltransferase